MIHVFGRRSKISRSQRRVGKRETGQCSSRFYMTSTEFLRVRPSRRHNPVTSNLMLQSVLRVNDIYDPTSSINLRVHCSESERCVKLLCGELCHEDTHTDERKKSNDDLTTIFSVWIDFSKLPLPMYSYISTRAGYFLDTFCVIKVPRMIAWEGTY